MFSVQLPFLLQADACWCCSEAAFAYAVMDFKLAIDWCGHVYGHLFARVYGQQHALPTAYFLAFSMSWLAVSTHDSTSILLQALWLSQLALLMWTSRLLLCPVVTHARQLCQRPTGLAVTHMEIRSKSRRVRPAYQQSALIKGQMGTDGA